MALDSGLASSEACCEDKRRIGGELKFSGFYLSYILRKQEISFEGLEDITK